MKLHELIPVMNVASPPDLLRETLRFTNRLGFDKVGAVVVLDHLCGEPEFFGVDNMSPEYCAVAASADAGRRDPVMQHCRHSATPIIWDRDTYLEAGQGEKWEGQASFGYRTGIALALHLPKGRHFFIGIDRDQSLPSNPNEVVRVVASLQLFAACAQDAALRVLAPTPPKNMELPSLTPRELEAVRWTMEGKTAWELGNILGISEQTAARHVNSATHKLGCLNKTQAVVKALRLGLIH